MASTLEYNAWRWKLKMEEANAQLADLRLHVALFLHCTNNPDTQPVPTFQHAPNPSPHASTWKKYLEEAARKVPRAKTPTEIETQAKEKQQPLQQWQVDEALDGRR